MEGALLSAGPDGSVLTTSLPREACTAGSDVADAIRLYGPGVHPSHASFRWIQNRATWELRPDRESAPVRVNGRLLPPGTAALLSAGDEILLGELHVRFRKIPAAPRCNGEECGRIDLSPPRLVLGRANPGAVSSPDRVDLDPEDSGLSREHAVIEFDGERHWLEDRSRAGTELNGQGSFGRRALVVGDRIRLRDYCFEYDGSALRQVDVAGGASIDTEHATVEVASADGPRAILTDVSVSIRSGEFVGILGGSGQGKTTLLQLLCGLIRPTSGEVRFNGIPAEAGDPRRPAVGYVPQDDLVHGELTVEEAITAAARLRLKATPAQIAALVRGTMDRLGLTEHAGKRIGSQLSGGQRKRVSIATELLTRPPVLLLDEPSSGLDPYAEEELMGFLQSLRNTGQTVLCTTHVLNRAYLFDRILFVHGGRLIFSGTPHEARLHFLEEDEETGSDSGQRAPLERIYREVQDSRRSAAEWETRYLQSPFAVRGRSQAPPVPAAEPVRDGRRGNSPLDLVRTLLHRQWRILRGDRMNLIFLAGQAAGIGLLIAWAAANPGLRLFLMIIATLWLGCSNAAQQIVSELAIYRRERVCGVGRGVFLAAKCGFFSAVTISQTLLLWLCTSAVARVLHGPVSEDAGMPVAAWLLRAGALGLAAVAGTGLGLAVSALARSVTQAVLLVPLLMIPQVLLGGYVITRPEMSPAVRAFAALWPSYAAQRIADVSCTLGRPVPLMTGSTRIPIFLEIRRDAATGAGPASGNPLSPAQEQVPVKPEAWTGEGAPSGGTLFFDRISDYNTAWRNVLVIPSSTGQHVDTGRATVTARNDVRMTQRDWSGSGPREVYRNAGPAVAGLTTLLAHCAVFYVVASRGLRLRERVRG